MYDESLTLFAILQNDGQRPSLLHNLGYVALHARDYARSRELFGESLGLFQRFGERRGVAECLIAFGSIAAAAGRPDRAARLFGAAEAAFETLGTQLSASNRADYLRHRAIARTSMRPAAFTAAWTSGQQLRLEQAVDEALQVTESGDSQPHANTGKRVDRPAGARARDQREASPLTAREQQVAELVRRGTHQSSYRGGPGNN